MRALRCGNVGVDWVNEVQGVLALGAGRRVACRRLLFETCIARRVSPLL